MFRMAFPFQFPMAVLANKIVRRFLPDETHPTRLQITTLWLMNQPIAFVRSAEFLRRAPFSLSMDQKFVDELVETLADLCVGGLLKNSGGRPA